MSAEKFLERLGNAMLDVPLSDAEADQILAEASIDLAVELTRIEERLGECECECYETECPLSDDDAHCSHWYDGETCCRCGDPPCPAMLDSGSCRSRGAL